MMLLKINAFINHLLSLQTTQQLQPQDYITPVQANHQLHVSKLFYFHYMSNVYVYIPACMTEY